MPVATRKKYIKTTECRFIPGCQSKTSPLSPGEEKKQSLDLCVYMCTRLGSYDFWLTWELKGFAW